jgi:putative MFS transporter
MFLVAKGRTHEAKKVIDDLVAKTGAPHEDWRLPAPQQLQRLSPKVMFAQLKDIWRFSPRRTAALWVLFLAVFLLYYGAVTWLPSILKAQGYGTYAAFMVTTLTVAVGIVSALVSAWLVDVFGRKWVIAISAPLAAVALVLFAVQLDVGGAAKTWITVYGVLIQVTIPALYAFAPELYPTHLRASGFGWASTISRVGAGFVPVLFGALLWPSLGLAWTFAVIGALVVAAVVVMMFVVPETRMQPLAEAVPS